MKKIAKIGGPAPKLLLFDGVQENLINLHQFLGNVILIEVFQLNCPGCFLYSLPQAVNLYHKYNNGLVIIGMATAFEDFEKNNRENLDLLLKHNKVVGETRRVLEAENKLKNGLLSYQIPFPVVMDRLTEEAKIITDVEVTSYIDENIPDFGYYNKYNQEFIAEKVLLLLKSQLIKPETFNLYSLKGTPSHIIIDRKGVLRACEFGQFPDLEWFISTLLKG